MFVKKLTKKNRTWLKWIVGFILSLLVIACLVTVYFNYRWKARLSKAIQNTVISATDSLYRISFSDIKINVITGLVSVDQIQLTPDLKIYEKLKFQKKAPENLIELKIPNLSIKKVDPLKVLRESKLDIDEITIENPILTVSFTKLKGQKFKDIKRKTAYENIKNVLKELKVGSVYFTNVKFKYIDYNFSKARITSIDHLNIRLNDILIDARSAKNTEKIYNATDVIAEIKDYEFSTPDANYKLKIKHAILSTQKKQLLLNGFSLIPRYTKIEYANRFKYQRERYSSNVDTILANHIDFNELLNERTIAASSIELINGNLDVFLNRSKPKLIIDKSPNFPHLALKRLAWGVNIDTLMFKKIQVSYGEYNPATKGTGTVYFNDLFASVYHVSNDSLAIQKNNFCKADISTSLMGEGNLNVHLGFNLSDPKGSFRYHGKLGAMQTSKINDITRPLGMITSSSGKINEMDFDIKGDINGTKGMLALNYSDLNIIIMKKESKENYVRMGIISLFANAFIVERNNPSKNQKLRIVYPYYRRPIESSFFNLMWKTVLVGLKESIGITKEKEAKIKRSIEHFTQAKKDREIRKLKRQKRKSDKLKLLINLNKK